MAIYFVNKRNETVYFGITDAKAVEQIQYAMADGHEAEKACHLMNRPMPTDRRIVYFIGDEAKYLAVNW